MGDWRDEALDEIEALKSYWIGKHGWDPLVVEGDDAVDLFIHLRGSRLGGETYLLRLHYQSDWQTAGRREAFVDPRQPSQAGLEFWPPEGIRGVNPKHRPDPAGPIVPCICLRGVWGYHSLLHANENPEGTSLLTFLLELQEVIDE